MVELSKRYNFASNKIKLIVILGCDNAKRNSLRAEWRWYVMFHIKR